MGKAYLPGVLKLAQKTTFAVGELAKVEMQDLADHELEVQTENTGYHSSFFVRALSRGRTEVGNASPHARLLEEGSEDQVNPYPIEPRRAGGSLKFEWKKLGGQTVYFKRVLHPPTKPYKIVERGVKQALIKLGIR